MKIEALLDIASLFFETLHPDFTCNEDKGGDDDTNFVQEWYDFVEAFFNQLHPDFTKDKFQ
jgi:hypothetical protein